MSMTGKIMTGLSVGSQAVSGVKSMKSAYKNGMFPGTTGTPMAQRNTMEAEQRKMKALAGEDESEQEKTAKFKDTFKRTMAPVKDLVGKANDKAVAYGNSTFDDLASGDGKRIAIGAAKAIPGAAVAVLPGVAAYVAGRKIEKDRIKKARRKGNFNAEENKIYPIVLGTAIGGLSLADAAMNKDFLAPYKSVGRYIKDNAVKIGLGITDESLGQKPLYNVGRTVITTIDRAQNIINQNSGFKKNKNSSDNESNQIYQGAKDIHTAKKLTPKDIDRIEKATHVPIDKKTLNAERSISFTPVDNAKAIKEKMTEKLQQVNSNRRKASYSATEKTAGILQHVPSITFNKNEFGKTVHDGMKNSLKQGALKGGIHAVTPLAIGTGSMLADLGIEAYERRRQKKLQKSASEKVAFRIGPSNSKHPWNISSSSGKWINGMAGGLATGVVSRLGSYALDRAMNPEKYKKPVIKAPKPILAAKSDAEKKTES